MTPGAYVYTVTGVAPCANASATVTVNETGSPNAGTDGSITVCSNGSSIDLFTQLTGADAGGTWSGPSAVIGSTYDPATMSAGVYTYTLVATAPCVGDASTVTVTENAATNAGTDGTLTVCSSSAAVSLFTNLGGAPQAGGTWAGPSPVVGGNYDPATMTPGAYVYTVTGVAPCSNASATVTVNETGSPNAGADGSITVCSNGSSIDLFTQLTGADAGGTWSGPSPVIGSTYDPRRWTAGVYTYTLVAAAPCVGDASTVTVTENAATNAGTDGTLTVCSSRCGGVLVHELGWSATSRRNMERPKCQWSVGNYDPATMITGCVRVHGDRSGTLRERKCNGHGERDGFTERGSRMARSRYAAMAVAIDLFTQLTGAPMEAARGAAQARVIGGTYDRSHDERWRVHLHLGGNSTVCWRCIHGNGHGERGDERRYGRNPHGVQQQCGSVLVHELGWSTTSRWNMGRPKPSGRWQLRSSDNDTGRVRVHGDRSGTLQQRKCNGHGERDGFAERRCRWLDHGMQQWQFDRSVHATNGCRCRRHVERPKSSDRQYV